MGVHKPTTVREATYALLRSFGVTTMFGNPGSTELPLFRDFPDDFEYVLGLQESIVLGMADGFARATGNAAFVNLHASAGVGHALGNLFTAFRNQTPLIITAGQQARSILPFDPFLFAQQPTEFPRPFVKWAIEPARAEDVPLAIARAYYMAMQRPRGPVFVSVPVDDWDQMCEPVTARRIGTDIRGDVALLKEAAEALSGAVRPAIVVGAGIGRDGAWRETIELAERHNAAVWVAPIAAHNAFPENHPLFAGFLTAARQKIVQDLTGYDVIVVLGGPLSLYHVEGGGPHTPPDAQLFLLGDDPSMLSWAPTGSAILTDLKNGVADLLALSQPQSRPAPAPRAPPPEPSGASLDDRYLVRQIARLRPEGSIVVDEAPSTRPAVQAYLPITDPDGFYFGASGGLGYGLPAAIGIALGKPKSRVIALLGDGSAMYAIQALWTAAQLELPISFIIVNNGRYEALIGFGHHFGLQRTVGTKLADLDFCKIAEGQGVSSVRVREPGALDEALRRSFADPRPNLVEVMVD